MIRAAILMMVVLLVMILPGSGIMQDLVVEGQNGQNLDVEGPPNGQGIMIEGPNGEQILVEEPNEELLQNPDQYGYVYIWLNGDGSELDRQGYPDCVEASTSQTPVKDADENYTYSFTNSWASYMREGDGAYFTIYIPIFTEQEIIRHTLTIHYQYEGGDQAADDYRENIAEGEQYAVSSPVRERFHSDPSTVSGTMGTQDIEEVVTYTAYRPTIRFVDEDGTELQSGQVDWDTMPAYAGETPTKAATAQYTYTFNAWDPAIAAVTGDATYTATYTETVNEYTIRFVNEDGTELQSGKNAYGETPVYAGETPTKAATAQYTYTFKAWDPAIAAVTGEATYTATYTETAIVTEPEPDPEPEPEPDPDPDQKPDLEPVNEYTIRFVNEDGTELQSGNVAYGETPVYAGETPTKAATAQYTYTFKSWDPAIAAVTGDATYTATYTETAIVTEPVTEPEPDPETVPETEQEPEPEPEPEPETMTRYTIRFVNEDGTELQSGKVAYGETPVYTGSMPTKAATAQYTYAFKSWDQEIATVTGEATYTATYSETVNEYTIRFVDEKGRELQSSRIAYGTTPVYTGETPPKGATTKHTYTFSGWKPAIGAVEGDATYTAVYTAEVNSYTIRFVDEDGMELQSGSVAYGETPAYTGETPARTATAKYTYTFSGWKPALGKVRGKATYKASYTATVNSYTIRFVDEDGTELQSGIVAYGETPAYTGETPAKVATAKYAYTFSGWIPALGKVTGDATYTAAYTATVNSYTIRFVNEDGTELQSGEVLKGETPVFSAETPKKESTIEYEYQFSGWEPEIKEATEDATYTATYTTKDRKYLVRYYFDNDWANRDYFADKSKYTLWEYHLLSYDAIPRLEHAPGYPYVFDPPLQTVTGNADYYLYPTEICQEEQEELKKQFGTTVTSGNTKFYENPETGETSAKLSPEKGEITWLRESSDETAAWYGFNNNSSTNREAALPEGSIVSVKWISKEDHPEEYERKVREDTGDGPQNLSLGVEDSKIWLFELNAYKKETGSDGKVTYELAKQNDFKDKMEYYVELGVDWDIDEINAIWLDHQEELAKPEIVTIEVNGVVKRFAKIELKHFSTYLLIIKGTF